MVATKDSKGNFVVLDTSHFRIYDSKGHIISTSPLSNTNKNISLLVDRSASMIGFDEDVQNAIYKFSTLPIIKYYCGIYEFGYNINIEQKPFVNTCNYVLKNYTLSSPDGQTPLYKTMKIAYTDIINKSGLSVLIIVSDGLPTDTPSTDLEYYSKIIPTFVLWVGNHSTNYIAKYTNSHAISQSGVQNDLEDFFKAISSSIYSHQMFNLKN